MEKGRVIFLILLLSLGELYGQKISFSPNTFKENGGLLTVTVVGEGVVFSQGSPTAICDPVKIYYPDVHFSGTNGNVYPDNITFITDTKFTASFTIGSISGDYKMAMGNICPATSSDNLIISPREIQITPAAAHPGETVGLKISGTGIIFQKDKPSECPDKLQITTSNVILRQGSTTLSSTNLSDVNANDFIASFNIPQGSPPGGYEVIIGENEMCAVKYKGLFNVIGDPSILNNTSEVHPGEQSAFYIYGSNLQFTEGPAECPYNIHIEKNNVAFKLNDSIYFPSDLISVTNDYVYGNISFPKKATPGYYDIITGYGGTCPLVCKGCLSVQPYTTQITFSPESAYSGNKVILNIHADNNLIIENAESGLCSPLQVNISNVTLTQASSTAMHPESVVANSTDSFTAVFDLPLNSTGTYYLSIGNPGCKFIYRNDFTVESRRIEMYKYVINRNERYKASFLPRGIKLSETEPTVCPDKLNVSSSKIIFKKGSYFFPPQSISNSNDGYYYASGVIPSNAPPGDYDLVVGLGEDCPVICKGCMEVSTDTISAIFAYSNSLRVGELSNIYIGGKGLSFSYGASSDCPYKFGLSTGNVVLKKDTSVFFIDALRIQDYKQMYADIRLPYNAQIGNYDLIVGYGQDCPLKCEGCIKVGSHIPTSLDTTFNKIKASPDQGRRGNRTKVNIEAKNFKFKKDSITVCPTKLGVNLSNVMIYQGSTTSIHPIDIQQYGDSLLTAIFDIPDNVPLGNYNIVVGNSTTCPSICGSCLTILENNKSISFTGNNAIRRQKVKMKVLTNNFVLTSNPALDNCADTIFVNPSSIVLNQNTSKILSDSIEIITSNSAYVYFTIPANAAYGAYQLILGFNKPCALAAQEIFVITTSDPSLVVYQQQTMPGSEIQINIIGENVVFQNDQKSNCPSYLYIDTSDVVLKKDSIIIIARKINTQSGSKDNYIKPTFFIPENSALGSYDVIVNYKGECPLIYKNGVTVIPGVSLEGPQVVYKGKSYDFKIKGHGLKFLNEGEIICSQQLIVKKYNVQFKSNTTSDTLTIHPYNINYDTENTISISIKIPDNIPSQTYSMNVNTGGSCNYFANAFFISCDSMDVSKIIIKGNSNVCVHSTQKYYLENRFKNEFTWRADNGILSVKNDTATVVWNTQGYGYLMIQNQCGTTKYLDIIIDTIAQIQSIAGNVQVCKGSSQIYSANNFTYHEYQYTWNVTGGGTIKDSNQIAMIKWTIPGNYKLTVIPKGACGIGATKEIMVNVGSSSSKPIIYDESFRAVDQYNSSFLVQSSSKNGNQWYKNGKPIPGAIYQTYKGNWEDDGYLAEYYLSVTDSCETLFSDPFMFPIPLKIENVEIPKDFKIFPNPASESFNIEIAEEYLNSNLVMEVYNNLSQSVMSQKISSSETLISLDPISNGFYFVQITIGDKVIRKKLMVAK